MSKTSKIKKQSAFCMELMTRLNTDIQNAKDYEYGTMDNHYTKGADAIRLRRELNTLREMLINWRYFKND